MGDSLTHTLSSQDHWSPSASAAVQQALVVLWCPSAPHRIGEVALLPHRGSCVMGRGEGGESDPFPRLALSRQRPGELASTGPLQLQSVSRIQAIFHVEDNGLAVERVGRCPMRVDGDPIDERAHLGPGATLELERQCLFRMSERPIALPASPGPLHGFGGADADGIVGETPAAWALRQEIAFIAPRNAHVLVHGASGSGKELVARAIHARSDRATGPFVSRSAATIPEGLVDAELFGHARDYPSSGMPAREGLVGAADGGTLFLDEFAELSDALQAHLLRVLDAGEYQRLGETRVRHSSFRLVGATNRPLSAIKHDVLARLPLIIEVPDLNARTDDIPLLARHVLRKIATSDRAIAERFFVGGTPEGEPRLTARLIRLLLAHPWTTHVRELEALLWQAMRTTGPALDLQEDPGRPDGGPPEPQAPSDWEAWRGNDTAAIPASALQACLDEHNGNQEATWRAMQLSSRHVLKRLIAKHGLTIRKSGLH